MSRVAALRPLARASRSPSVSIPRRLHTTRLLRASESPRYYSPPREKKGIKIGYLFSGLALLGITATSLGLYRFYSTYTAYPNTTSHPIRTLLRRALTASNAGDPARASAAFAQAYALALDLASRGELGSSEESLMRTSGIVIRCGAMWEAVGQLAKARENYELAWGECKDRIERGGAGEKEVMRAVGVALKVGDLWVEEGAVGDKEAEAYFVWAVETMMRLGMNAAQKEKVREEVVHGVVPAKGEEKTKEGREDGWDLPEWLGKVELVAGFERLGDLYARIGKPEYAQPLLQQAIATLVPPPPKEGPTPAPPPITTRCHAATLMNNLSSSFVTAPSPSASAIDQASRWARQALLVSAQCRKEADKSRKGAVVPLDEREDAECEMTAAVAAFNLGKLSELSGDKTSARSWFEKSSKQSQRIGMREGVQESLEALRRLDR